MYHATKRALPEHRERRRGKRFEADWPIIIKSKRSDGPEIEDEGSLINISCSGALAYLRTTLPLGGEVEVHIRLPLGRDAWMGYRAKIARVENTPAGPAIGIRFDPARPVFTKK